MMHRASYFLIALLIANQSAPKLQGAEADQVDAYVQAEMQKQKIPGLAVLIVRDGTIAKSQGYGLANVEHQVPVKPETIFQSGSMGKQFTATAMMMLVEQGKVALDDPVSKHLGEIPEAWKPITVRHLLSHTAGVGEYPESYDLRRDYSEDELLQSIYRLPLVFAPGEKWRYSNPGYIALGILIHKVTGQFYGDFLQDRIFKPLGMTSTRIISDADIISNRAAGYRVVKGELKNQEWVSPTMNSTADGSLYLNIVDLAKWDAVLYTERLLKRESLEQMWKPAVLNSGKQNFAGYGFGWMSKDVHGHRVIEHAGAWQGFTSHIARFVDDRLTVVVLANLAGSNPPKIARHVAGLYLSELLPDERTSIEDTEPELTAILREQLSSYLEGKADRETFVEEARDFLFSDDAKPIVAKLVEYGKLQSLTLSERSTADGYRVYKYRAKHERGPTFVYTFHLTETNKIARLSVDTD
jgi:CubicO group peptidase (beta-lactamase class C family)